MNAKAGLTDDNISLYGPRGGKYTIQEWLKKHGHGISTNRSNCTEHEGHVQLVVDLPPEEENKPREVRPKTSMTQPNVVLQPILAYVHYALQSGTADAIKKAVLGLFTVNNIKEAKDILFQHADNSITGAVKSRQDGVTRTQSEADAQDIINAMIKLDRASSMPIFAVPSLQLGIIPRSHPEELNNITLVDKLHQLDEKWTRCQELMDRALCENMALTERVTILEQHRAPAYSTVLSGTAHACTSIEQNSTVRNVEYPLPRPQRIQDYRAAHRPEATPASGHRSNTVTTGSQLRVPGTQQANSVMKGSQLRVPDAKHIRSVDNTDNTSIRSGASGTSGFQYQRQYQKKLQRQNKPKIITGTNKPQGSASSTCKGAPEPDRHLC